MRLDLLRQPLSIVFLQYFTLLALIGYRAWYFPGSALSFSDERLMPLGERLAIWSAAYPGWNFALCALLLFIVCICISRTVSANLLYGSRTYLPFIFYLVASCGVGTGSYISPMLLVAVMLSRSIEIFAQSFQRVNFFGSIFRGGLLLGLCVLIYAPAACFILLLPAAALIFKRNGRETIVGVAGFILPVLLSAYVIWAMDGGFVNIFVSVFNKFYGGWVPVWPSLTGYEGKIFYTFAGIVAVTFFSSIFVITATAKVTRTRAVRLFRFLALVAFIATGMFFLAGGGREIFPVLAVPVAFLAPGIFAKSKGWYPATLYTLLLCSVIFYNVMPVLF